MDDRRTHITDHERPEQRDSGRKLQTNCLPSIDVETVDKYILRSNVWTLEILGRNYCQMNRTDVERSPEGQKINF